MIKKSFVMYVIMIMSSFSTYSMDKDHSCKKTVAGAMGTMFFGYETKMCLSQAWRHPGYSVIAASTGTLAAVICVCTIKNAYRCMRNSGQ